MRKGASVERTAILGVLISASETAQRVRVPGSSPISYVGRRQWTGCRAGGASPVATARSWWAARSLRGLSFARRWRDSGVPICRDDAIKVYYLNDWRKLRVHTDDPDATLLGRVVLLELPKNVIRRCIEYQEHGRFPFGVLRTSL